jgi:hypothetical protein
MIQTEVGLRQSIELLGEQYEALADLHRRIAPLNFANYQVFAEGPLEQIRRLQHEIHEYLGVSTTFTEESQRA